MKDLKKYKNKFYRFDNLISNDLRDRLSYLKEFFTPYTNKVYLVGGGVRDIFLDNPLKDLDLEVHNIDIQKFDTLMNKLNAKGIGKSFFVYKLDNFIDISLPRVENKSGYGHKGFEVKLAKNEYEASIRRDFTINAMMLNIYDYTLIDYHNGQNDLQTKTLRLINKEKFCEDSLRVLRGIQFCARFNLKIEKNTFDIMNNIDLSDLSKDRIYTEFEKLFLSSYLERGFYYLIKLKIFEKIMAKSINKQQFYKIYRLLKNQKKYFTKENYKYYFLYIIIKNSDITINDLQKFLNLPNIYIKILKNQPIMDKNISIKDLLTISLKTPIKDCLLNMFCEVTDKAIKLNIYNTILDTKISAKDVIKDGFESKNISIEIKRREIEYINKLVSNINII